MFERLKKLVFQDEGIPPYLLLHIRETKRRLKKDIKLVKDESKEKD